MKPLARIRSLNANVRSIYGGGVTGWFRLLRFSLLRVNRFGILAVDAGAGAPAAAEGIVFDWLDDDTLHQLRQSGAWPPEFPVDGGAGIRRCCVGRVNGEVAYVHWVYRTGERSRFLRIEPGAAEINYILTRREYRGRGLCRNGVLFTLRELDAEGVRTVYAVVHEGNVNSLRALQGAGMREVSVVRAWGPVHRKHRAGPLEPVSGTD